MQITGNFWIDFIISLLGLAFAHELGHYLTFLLFGVKPKFIFEGGTIAVYGRFAIFKLTPIPYLIVTWMGLVFSLIYSIALFREIHLGILIILSIAFANRDMSDLEEATDQLMKHPELIFRKMVYTDMAIMKEGIKGLDEEMSSWQELHPPTHS